MPALATVSPETAVKLRKTIAAPGAPKTVEIHLIDGEGKDCGSFGEVQIEAGARNPNYARNPN
jgi:hypothetical protein